MVIWKFTLDITDIQELTMPAGATLLSVANQNGSLCLWAMVDASKENETRTVEIKGTGHRISDGPGVDRNFIGTAVIGSLVWHVFELR